MPQADTLQCYKYQTPSRIFHGPTGDYCISHERNPTTTLPDFHRRRLLIR